MKTKSIWGVPPSRLYRLIRLAEETLDDGIKACIVGCSDGKFLMPFARKHYEVVGYDIDDIALYGGNKEFPLVNKKKKYQYSKNFISKQYRLETRRVTGVAERLDLEDLGDYAKVEKVNFYGSVVRKKFNVVFTSCSLHYSINKEFTLEEKIKKLESIVTDGGYLYIDYMMAIEEDNYDSYPKNKFFRSKEIARYFGKDWEIISFRENSEPSFEGAHVDCVKDHFHRFGYILARKIKNNYAD